MTPRNLTPASGRQDHTTLPSASASFVRALFARLTLPRPPHPAPNVRDDRETPLCVGRDGGVLELIWVGGEAEYFLQARLDRRMTNLPGRAKSRAGTNRVAAVQYADVQLDGAPFGIK